MKRRTLLAATATLAGLPGCLGGGSDAEAANPNDFETTSVDGIDVPLAPMEVVHGWFEADEARFVDARSASAYRQSHIEGAVLSPAPDGLETDDPVADWPTDARIVTYCGCPHHLSSMRAASLIASGYVRAYALDEGFWAWHNAGYPLAGEEVDQQPALRRIRGRTDSAFAGQTAWARHPASGQREAAPIETDGTYALDLRFAGVTPDDPVVVETPGYRVEAPLSELTGAVVGPGGV